MPKMTIAQGLRRVKSLKGKVAELSARGSQVVTWSDKMRKHEFDFHEVRKQRETAKTEKVKLEAAIQRANATHELEFEGEKFSITEAVRRLDEMKDDLNWLGGLGLRFDVQESHNYEQNEQGQRVRVTDRTNWTSALTEKERVTQVDELKERFQKLNDLVERENHRVELD